MRVKIAYPRVCDLCDKTYSCANSYSNHRQNRQGLLSVCLRRQSERNAKIINSQNNDVSGDHNSIYNACTFNLPEWINIEELKHCMEDLKSIKTILEKLQEKGIEGASNVRNYIQKNAFAFSDFQSALTRGKPEELIDKVICSIKNTNSKRDRVLPLLYMYNMFFVKRHNNNVTGIDECHTRPFYMKREPGECDVLSYENPKNSKSPLGWQTKHWNSLMSDVLFMLGQLLYNRIRKEKIKNSNGEDFAFVTWWLQIQSKTNILLDGDPDVTWLMNTISKDLIQECKNDVMIGWYRLIDYCRVLHETDTPVAEPEELVKLKDEYAELMKIWQAGVEDEELLDMRRRLDSTYAAIETIKKEHGLEVKWKRLLASLM